MDSEAVGEQIPQQPSDSRPAQMRRRLFVLSLVSLVAGAGITGWAEHLRYEKFIGHLQARFRTVSSLRDARVAEVLVSSGALVMAGDPVVRLEDADYQQKLGAQQREVESLEIQLAQAQARLEVELELRRRDILDRIFEAKLKAAQASRAPRQSLTGFASSSTSSWERAAQSTAQARSRKPAAERSLITHASAAVASTTGDSANPAPQSEFDLCAQHIEELERSNRELPDKIARMLGIDLAQAHLDHARAELAALEAKKTDLTLVAETSGLVGVFQKSVGDHVAAFEPIVQILDEEQPYLVVQIPSSRVADFAPGTLVDLKFPGRKSGVGRVVEIPPQTSTVDATAVAETRIAIHVDPVGVLWPELPFGSVVEVRRRR